MNTLYLLHYNNYYDRIVKKEDTIADYIALDNGKADGDPKVVLGSISGVNFVPLDGVNTEQVINWAPRDHGDYLIVLSEEGNIESRWFIINSKRLRRGQFLLTLHRDLVADYYDAATTADAFIEKATVRDVSDPAIFNDEDMAFNQIKTEETLLPDGSGVPWIVGYIPRDATFSEPITVEYSIPADGAIEEDSISKFPYYRYSVNAGGSGISGAFASLQIFAFMKNASRGYLYYSRLDGLTGSVSGVNPENLRYSPGIRFTSPYTAIGGLSTEITLLGSNMSLSYSFPGEKSEYPYGAMFDVWRQIPSSDLTTFHNDLRAAGLLYVSTKDSIDAILKLNGAVYRDTSTGKFYRLRVTSEGIKGGYVESNNTLRYVITPYFNRNPQPGHTVSGDFTDSSFYIYYARPSYRIEYQEIVTTISTNLSLRPKANLKDAPYDMFCIPYGSAAGLSGVKVVQGTNTVIEQTDPIAGLNLAVQIPLSAGSANIYDLQLLPYFPQQDAITSDGSIDLNKVPHSFITDASKNNISVVFWPTVSSFSFSIDWDKPRETDVLQKKVKNLTDMYRLCSPNYSGAFEFSLEKNDGCDRIQVDAFYKPYEPYIHLNPDFAGLYGSDFNDLRGLQCGGDFSLPQLTSAWADYQLNNKTYQASFDRQIQNMEVNNAIQRKQEIAQAVTGSVSGLVSGVQAGASAGGWIGAIVGGVVGAGAAAAGGALDVKYNDMLRNEALDYTKDQFGYSLQNIQALPQGLSKTSALTPNNKYFPFIEYYTCSDIEKQALMDKMKYNGMTIMRIGKMVDFIQSEPTYIKCKMIRISPANSIPDDYHLVSALAEELNKGVFI